MVRDNIQYQPHASLPERRGHAVKTVSPAYRGVNFVGIGNVIAVGGIRCRGKNR